MRYQTKLVIDESEQPPVVPREPLGKRHSYNKDEIEADIATSARSIGFSKAEIAELERLYRDKSSRG